VNKTDLAAIQSIAVAYPNQVRTNDYFRQNYPDAVAGAERKSVGKIWAPPAEGAAPADLFDAEAAPYMTDPFRGAVRRRCLKDGETMLDLELRAARGALDALHMRPEEVDLLIASALVSDTIGVGSAAHLASKLGLRGAAWNLETACSSAAVALQTASALVRAGEYRNALVVSSCSYSREAEPSDTLSWFVGDGAGAFVVGPSKGREGILGTKTIHTAETCGAFSYGLEVEEGRPKVRMRWNGEVAKIIRETSIVYLRTCCEGAMQAAGVKVGDIAFFVFNTPTAWYASFCAHALGVDVARTVDTYPLYANMGPALLSTNLYRAAKDGRLRPGDLVLLYTIGSTSSASASVMRWGDVALGPDPEAP
jgi:3-oxoacyl-[acyl-carrier-protein] synthase-3